VQRFFVTTLPWASLFWAFFGTHLFDPEDVYLLAGDEVVVTKAGKHTHGLAACRRDLFLVWNARFSGLSEGHWHRFRAVQGCQTLENEVDRFLSDRLLDRFFSSLAGKPVPGLAFFTLSLISTRERHSFQFRVEQVVRSAAERAAAAERRRGQTATPPTTPRKRGRPPGSTHTDKTAVALTPELQRIKGMVQGLLQRIRGVVLLTYLVFDGHFGANTALQMVRHCDLHLISKLRADSAFYLR